jgi:hypothetical protein
MPSPAVIRCYAEGRPGHWEAFCLNFDLAVQGKSFPEVYSKLNDQVHLYVEGVSGLPAKDRARLLHRSAPFGTWARYMWALLATSAQDDRGYERHNYTLPIKDACRAAA